MEYSRIAASRVRGVPVPGDRRSARPTRMSVRIPRVNLLVVGPEDAVEEVLVLVRADGTQDGARGDGALMAHWRPGNPFVLPPPTSHGRLIVHDVDTLVHGDQHRLLEWLEQACGRIQVVSTASASLMPLVDAGVFMQTLYYRLNTIYLDLTARRFSPGDW